MTEWISDEWVPHRVDDAFAAALAPPAESGALNLKGGDASDEKTNNSLDIGPSEQCDSAGAATPPTPQGDEEAARKIIAVNTFPDSGDLDRSGLQIYIIAALAAARAEGEAKAWREAAQRAHDVPRSHLPDYFNSIADQIEREAKP